LLCVTSSTDQGFAVAIITIERETRCQRLVRVAQGWSPEALNKQ
jgi:hypothetical protein